MAIATIWLSAIARMAIPRRLRRKNHPNIARNRRLTAAPASWIGGRKSGPSTTGSSPTGSGSAFVSAPHSSGPIPRSTAASPMVAMIMATMGRFSSGRRTTRSSPKPSATMPSTAAPTAAHTGARWVPRATAARKPPIMTNSPCAKLMASVAL